MVSGMKECSNAHHYESEHKQNFYSFTAELRKKEINLKGFLIGQQNIFKVKCIYDDSGVCATCIMAVIVAKTGRLVTDLEFVKQYMLAVMEEVFPGRKRSF
jgi:hypothetical protein